MNEPQTAQLNPWTPARLIGAAFLVAAGVAVMWHAWSDILRLATRNEENSHILLVPIVVVWLVLARRDQWARCRVGFSPVGPLIMAAGWGISVFGFYNAFQSLWHGGALLVAVGAFVTVIGPDVVRRIWPAFVVLLFLVPVPGLVRLQIALPMQEATAAITTRVSDLFFMDVKRSGSVMQYNGVDVAIAEACNGMRMIFALILVSFAFAFGTPLRTWVRVLIILLSPVSAIVCNVIRLVPTLYIYGHYEAETAELFHDIAGWVMLVMALGLLMGLVRLLQWLCLPVTPDDPAPPTSPLPDMRSASKKEADHVPA